MRRLAVVVSIVLGVWAAPARAQDVRLAAPADCLTNSGCGKGLKSVYGLEVRSVFTPLTVADAGVEGLDNGVAEVAVAFSSNPQLSRPDIVTLADDKRMGYADRVVPVVRRGTLRTYGAGLRRRLNAASALLSTLALRGLNQSVIDGRLPEAVGGEFIEANGLGGTAKRRHGRGIVMDLQDCPEDETLAELYAVALRAGGFRVVVRSVHGLRPEAVRLIRRGRIDMFPGYSGSL